MILEEAIVGAIFAISFSGWLGPWVLAAAPLCAWLWALGGATAKGIRRIGCPMVVGAALWHTTGNWVASLIWVPVAWVTLSVGYGLPSTQPPDAGSVLGRWAYAVCRKNERLASILTRSLIIGVCVLDYAIINAVTK